MTNQEHWLLKHYVNVMEDWKARMALQRMQLMGFPQSDWPDLMQELALLIVKFEYDPDNEQEATEETALFAVIHRHLLFRRRTEQRRQGRFRRTVVQNGFSHEYPDRYREPAYEQNHMQRFVQEDVRRVLAQLSQTEQFICRCLTEGLQKKLIAEQLDWNWKRLDRVIDGIRARFKAHDLDGEGL